MGESVVRFQARVLVVVRAGRVHAGVGLRVSDPCGRVDGSNGLLFGYGEVAFRAEIPAFGDD